MPMTLSGGVYRTTITLADDQTVSYKFLVNGGTWLADPANGAGLPDGFGGWNSVISVDCGQCPASHFDWRDGILYFALVDRFVDGDPSNDTPVAGVETPANYQGGDLAGVKQKIDDGYFTDLGVNVLWLSAPYGNASGSGLGDDGHLYSAYHGYWPSDLTVVDPRVGDLATLTSLVDDAHAHGLRVVLDYVMNHVHQESPIYTAHPDWFWPNDNCVCGVGCSWDTLPDRLRCWFEPYLPDFDFQIADARAWSTGNALEWIGKTGIDGFRLDAVKHIETSWITDLRAMVAPGFYLIGETYTSDRDLIHSYVDPSTMLDGQFDFPLRAQVVRSLLMRAGAMSDLASFMDSNDGFYGAHAVMGTFLGNHDLPRAIHLAEDTPQFGEWDSGRGRAWSNQPSLPGNDAPFERLALGFALLMTTPGMPLVYYGDELGMPGAGDPDNRRMMSFTGVEARQWALKTKLTKLTKLRQAHRALRIGTRHTLASSFDGFTYVMIGGGEVIYVAMNRGDGTITADGLPPSAQFHDLLADTDVTGPISLAPRSVMILEPKGSP
jgi:glycosidase